jgi:II/X family phage/plasmid replication protein
LRDIRDLKLPVEGSYSDKVVVFRWCGPAEKDALRTGLCDGRLFISGNPQKWYQHHNVFGSDDCRPLGERFVHSVLEAAGIKLSSSEETFFSWGHGKLTRVDCTGMLDFGSDEAVEGALRHLKKYASYKNRKRITKGETVYLGDRSGWWSLKFYNKFREVTSGKKGHTLGGEKPFDEWKAEELVRYSEGCLRVELQLRSKELEKRELGLLGHWSPGTCQEQLLRVLEGVVMPEQMELSEGAVADLPASLRKTYAVWKAGWPLRECLSDATFYRHRKALLALAIDISELPSGVARVELRPDNVLPFVQRYASRGWKGVPDWAVGTPMYFDPNAKVVGE